MSYSVHCMDVLTIIFACIYVTDTYIMLQQRLCVFVVQVSLVVGDLVCCVAERSPPFSSLTVALSSSLFLACTQALVHVYAYRQHMRPQPSTTHINQKVVGRINTHRIILLTCGCSLYFSFSLLL